MRIGMFSDVYFPQKNGVSTAVKLFKEKLENLGHEVFVFVPRYSKELKRNERGVIEFPSMKYFLEKEQRIAFFPPTAFMKIKKMKLDIIHLHTPFSMGTLGYWSAKFFNIPHVGTYHTMYEHYRHYLPTIIRPSLGMTKKMIRNWCKKLDKVIAPTNEIKRVLIQYGVPEDHIVVIPTGIDVEKFQKPKEWDLREALDLEDEKILLYVGRLGKEKNLDFLLRVFRRVQKEERSVFVIIGYGPEEENLKELARDLGISERVLFLGGMERDRVVDAYKAADVFIFASYTETQGLVILEAMAAGLPVVALGKMGVKDLLQESGGGIMVEELNEEEFARKILDVLRSKKLQEELSKMGRSFVEEKFSIDASVRKLVDLYEEIIKNYEEED